MNDIQYNKIYYPMLISNLGTTEDMTKDQEFKLWKKYFSLPQEKQNILTDEQLPHKIAQLQSTLNLPEENVGKVSLFIREFFFNEAQLRDLKNYIPVLDDQQLSRIVEYIQGEVLTIKPKLKVEEVERQGRVFSQSVQLPLLQALSKYSQIGNQLITKERIKIKSQVEPVRPSLIYWLKYYRDELGVGHHDSVQRGQFLFRSENGKKLSGEERERVNLILKSIEENLPLDIDTVANEIVFPHFEADSVKPITPQSSPSFTFEAPIKEQSTRVPERAFPTGQTVPLPAVKKAALPGKGILSFSSPHVFQAEKEKAEPKRVPTFNANPFHIRPVSMQDDEEQNL